MWRELRSALGGLVTGGVLVGVGPAVAAASSDANRLVRVSGTSPFTGCPTAGLDALLPTGEVEPVVVANPTDPANPRLVYGVVPTFSYPSEAGGSFRGTVVVARSLDGGSRCQLAKSVVAT